MAVSSGLSLGATTLSFYTFTVFSANATIGAVYGNNGNLFTVLTTLSAGTTLLCSATGIPSGGATTLTKVSGTGDATISVSASTTAGTYPWVVPTGISRVITEAIGGGGSGSDASHGSATIGGNTVFNGTIVGPGGYSAQAGNSPGTTTSTSLASSGVYAGGGVGVSGQGSPFFVGGPSSGGSVGGGGGSSDYGTGGTGQGGSNGAIGNAFGAGGSGAINGSGGAGCKRFLNVFNNLTPGSTITISVGAGGTHGFGGGYGAAGNIYVNF